MNRVMNEETRKFIDEAGSAGSRSVTFDDGSALVMTIEDSGLVCLTLLRADGETAASTTMLPQVAAAVGAVLVKFGDRGLEAMNAYEGRPKLLN